MLGAEEDLARELVTSLTRAQRTKAIVSTEAPRDIFTGNIGKPAEQWDAWRETLLPAGDLRRRAQRSSAALGPPHPRRSRRRLPSRAVGRVPAQHRSQDLELRVARCHRARRAALLPLQGADFVFEYDNVQDNGNHVHSVWRNKSEDFGMQSARRALPHVARAAGVATPMLALLLAAGWVAGQGQALQDELSGRARPDGRCGALERPRRAVREARRPVARRPSASISIRGPAITPSTSRSPTRTAARASCASP